MKLCPNCEKYWGERSSESEQVKVELCNNCHVELERERFHNRGEKLKRVRASANREGTCRFEDSCERPIWARQFCRSHYEKLTRMNVRRKQYPRKKVEKESYDHIGDMDLWDFVVAELKKKGHFSVRKL